MVVEATESVRRTEGRMKENTPVKGIPILNLIQGSFKYITLGWGHGVLHRNKLLVQQRLR